MRPFHSGRDISSNFLLFALLFTCTFCVKTDEKEAIEDFNHVMLYVSDMEKSIRFYEQALGLEVHKRIEEVQIKTEKGETETVSLGLVMMKFPNSNFVLELSEQSYTDPMNQAIHFQHMGITVKNLDEAVAKAMLAGAKKTQENRTISDESIIVKNTFVSGPDGELIELMEFVKGRL
jgi:catechol 2,3-dioxygenase-like lactoylglutathione lyase family enzyme